MSGEAERFFDAIAGRYDREYALPASVSKERMARVLRELPTAPARVLDLGVGTGRELPALLDAGYAPTGVDVSREMIERCGRRARPVPLVRCDFWGPLPFEVGSFDAVVALHGTLAHEPHEGSLLALGEELGRVVVAGGTLVAEVPTPAWLDRLEGVTGSGDRVLRRTGTDTCVFEDRVAGASIEARVLGEDGWRSALGAEWSTRVEGMSGSDGLEWFVVAVRRGG
jgi:SAM-dependent methyltransferase